eukprot:scaffold11970_cov112-Isochrysis_galbana.AAC.2
MPTNAPRQPAAQRLYAVGLSTALSSSGGSSTGGSSPEATFCKKSLAGASGYPDSSGTSSPSCRGNGLQGEARPAGAKVGVQAGQIRGVGPRYTHLVHDEFEVAVELREGAHLELGPVAQREDAVARRAAEAAEPLDIGHLAPRDLYHILALEARLDLQALVGELVSSPRLARERSPEWNHAHNGEEREARDAAVDCAPLTFSAGSFDLALRGRPLKDCGLYAMQVSARAGEERTKVRVTGASDRPMPEGSVSDRQSTAERMGMDEIFTTRKRSLLGNYPTTLLLQ